MPYRLVTLWVVIVGLLGVIALGLLVALGKNPRRVAANATGWKRKLLIAGLALLGLGGVADAQDATDTPTSAAQVSEPAEAVSALQDSEEWQRFDAGWRQAEAASGLSYFETEAEQQACLEEINVPALQADLVMLVNLDLLTENEGQFLTAALAELEHEIRLIQAEDWSRYRNDSPEPMASPWARAEEMFPLLETIAAQEAIDPAVVEKMLASIDDELDVMLDDWGLSYEVETRVQESSESAQAVEAHLRQVAEQFSDVADALATRGVDAAELEATPQWQRIVAAWQAAGEILADSENGAPFTTREKGNLMAALSRAQGDAGRLVEAGHLTAGEAGLLADGTARLRDRIGELRASDVFIGTCYIRVSLVYAPAAVWQRWENMDALLEDVLAQETLSPTVAARLLQSVQDDLPQGDGRGTLHMARWLIDNDDRYADLTEAEMMVVIDARKEELLAVVEQLQARLEAMQDQAAE